jgi:hypothetical protein
MALKKKPKKKRKYLKCERCGKRKSDVEKCYDPYLEKINKIKYETQLCGDCFQDCLNDI